MYPALCDTVVNTTAERATLNECNGVAEQLLKPPMLFAEEGARVVTCRHSELLRSCCQLYYKSSQFIVIAVILLIAI